MVSYEEDWDLKSIPASKIPQDLLKIWWSHYTNSKRQKKQVDDPKERERLDKQAKRMRDRRAAGLA